MARRATPMPSTVTPAAPAPGRRRSSPRGHPRARAHTRARGAPTGATARRAWCATGRGSRYRRCSRPSATKPSVCAPEGAGLRARRPWITVDNFHPIISSLSLQAFAGITLFQKKYPEIQLFPKFLETAE